MAKEPKHLIQQETIQDRNLQIIQKHFPGALEKDPETGGYTLNTNKLQHALDPAKVKVEEDGYELRWVGKKLAFHEAYAPNHKLLKPLPQDSESKNFDTTQNILIKADNLDALKILCSNYFEKIKMIYIDPPYNTKSDEFIYNDNFTENDEDILKKMNYCAEDIEYIKNLQATKTHTGWLTFIYSRLLLAKDLLKPDGVIFISIDDYEEANLKVLCNEVFGEVNFVGVIIRKTKSVVNLAKDGMNTQHESCLVYSKDLSQLKIQGELKDFSGYKNSDNDPRGDWDSVDPSVGNGKHRFPIVNPYTERVDNPPKGRYWCFPEEKFKKLVEEKIIIFKKDYPEGEKGFILKNFLSEVRSEFNLINSLFATKKGYMNQVGTKERNALFGEKKVIDYPKPTPLIEKLAQYSTEKDDIILDFFAGSGTTAHAVMQLNAKDNGNRKIILVQKKEEISEKSKDAIDFLESINKPTNIFEICAERIRRAGEAIKQEKPDADIDIGFKIFEVIDDDKNLIYNKHFDEIEQSNMGYFETHDLETILYSFMAADGIELSEQVETIIEDKLYIVGNSAYIFDTITEEQLHAIKSQVEYLTIYSYSITNSEFYLKLEDMAVGMGFDREKIRIRA